MVISINIQDLMTFIYEIQFCTSVICKVVRDIQLQ